MYITKEKFEAIVKNHRSLLVVEGDVSEALEFVQELLEAEADALKKKEPHATVSIQKLNDAAYQVFEVCGEIENEEFLENKEEELTVVRTLDELEDYLDDKGWSVYKDEDGWDIRQASPAGEDFGFYIRHGDDVEQAIKEIKEYAYDFDIDEHVELNLGGRGAPGVVELVEDAKEIQKMLDELADGVNWCEQKTVKETIQEATQRSSNFDVNAQKGADFVID